MPFKPDHPEAPAPCQACAVRSTGVCDVLSDADLMQLDRISSHLALTPREVIFYEEDESSHVYNIVSGIVRLTKHLADGRRAITGFLYPGDFLGLPFRPNHYCSAESVTPVELCSYPRTQLEGLFTDIPQLEARLFANAANEIVAQQVQMIALGRKTPDEKLAHFLTAHAERAQESDENPNIIKIHMTRSDIADYLGLTIETVSRTFTRMSKDGLIRLHKSDQIEFIRPNKLQELAAGGM